MSKFEIRNELAPYRRNLQAPAFQDVLALAELQLGYLFRVIKSGQEEDFYKALSGYTSIVAKIRNIPDFRDDDGEWRNVLKQVKKLYARFSEKNARKSFAREAVKIFTPFLSCSALVPEPLYEWFGCFRYNFDPEMKHIYLHFRNACVPDSPFAVPYDRLGELAAIIKDIENKELLPETIGCDSWLNELKVFQAFFPLEYRRSFKVSPPDSKSGYGWWGQFIGSDGKINEYKLKKFAKDMTFPYKRIIARCRYAAFAAYVCSIYQGMVND